MVKKVHILQQGPVPKSNSKISRTKSKDFSDGSTLKKNKSYQDFKMIEDDDNDVSSDVDMDDFLIQWSTIKKCASEQQMARSWAEADNRLLQIENYLTYIITKLESIDQAISNMHQGVSTIW